MKILGIGVDIIDNKRIKESIKNDKFKRRIYSSNEIKLSKKTKNKVAFFSKRFAAKEAFSKALGTGFSSNLNFKDIEMTKKACLDMLIIKKLQKLYKKNIKSKNLILFSQFQMKKIIQRPLQLLKQYETK